MNLRAKPRAKLDNITCPPILVPVVDDPGECVWVQKTKVFTARQLCDSMQCIWQLSARLSAHGLRRAPSVTYGRCSRLASTAPSVGFCPIPPLSDSQSAHKTPSRLSLDATHAVHKSLKDRALEHGFHVVNSLRYAALPESQKQDKMWDKIRASLVSYPPGVSPRLPAHALIHGLVRTGMPMQASALATSMMNSGFRIRYKTLEKVVDGLAKSAADKKAVPHETIHFKEYMANLLGTPKILSLNSSMSSNPSTVFALELLQAAKEGGSQRSNVMFDTLITLCLINGEIILAALLFGALVKDWEHRSVVLTQMTAGLPEAPEATQPSTDVNKASRYHLMTKPLQPQHGTLNDVMAPIREKLAKATIEDVNTPEFQETLQSLAYLASLLDERKLPFDRISSIVHALANCPTVENWVWVTKGRDIVCVPANRYFHDVLLRLIRSLPDEKPRQRSIVISSSKITSIKYRLVHSAHGMQPPLDLATYNTLMHYALRNRFSPALAQQVYEHMTVKRKRPIRKSAVSHGIFLRAATLYGRKDAIGEPLQALPSFFGSLSWQPVVPAKPKVSTLPRRLVPAGRSEIKLPPAPPLEAVMKDRVSFSIYLSALLSCQKQKTVYQIMLRYLPYFARINYTNNAPSYLPIKQDAWNRSVANAASLGPHILCSFIIALTRSLRYHNIMTLFKIILSASEKSMEGEGRGWAVPVTIYTAVLQGRYLAYKRRSRRWIPEHPTTLERLLQITNDIYDTVMYDVRNGVEWVGTPDARFYGAVLKILSSLIPAPKSSIKDAKCHLELARERYAHTGLIENRRLEPLMQKVAVDMQEDGYTVPVGFQYLFLDKGMTFFENHSHTPELERRPSAFKKSFKTGGPYSIPIYNHKTIPLRRHFSSRNKTSPKRRTSE
ncbi:hypothetical protein AGABI2DRAFT_116722 [Agaricus bisporus var. bisporus H97]|uniref:hypothetical protein n=1 Tax=Agaricus bisporus var. bisporus (strain H97 / ATCC MYA-4626 / FGSC 10389) TaxID=936046 RepID=UPI00029F5069|nr:hypothetical protein AGABI2DRAFT_116722 [Agaricus bisporus var. bisporus H97]EKV47911.1 hypothetical protein AGABI2DRAFT_116722 [Agaricus bisporus var. bisporus H97]